MRGSGWLDGNGAGRSIYDHRITLQPANGTVKPDQAYAIDWIKLDEQGHTFDGDPFKNESFFAYGQPILSASDGVVVSAEDGFPNQIPKKFEPIKQIKSLYGNNVVVAIGGGKYAVYAHLKPAIAAVKVGDHVHAGRQLGEVGNSGNSGAAPAFSNFRPRSSTRTRCRSSSTRCTTVSASLGPSSRPSMK
jgi:hypothetical protein